MSGPRYVNQSRTNYVVRVEVNGAQTSSARHARRWTVSDLAANAGVSVNTIKRIEVDEGVPSTMARNLMTVRSALESAGIEFIGTPDDAPGIRIHTRAPRAR